MIAGLPVKSVFVETSTCAAARCVREKRPGMTDYIGSRSAGRAARRARIARGVPGLRSALLTASVMLLVACGDGGGGDQNSTNPTISGTPPGSVLQNTAYSFQPSASDPNGDKLTFSISGKPAWASFDTA